MLILFLLLPHLFDNQHGDDVGQGDAEDAADLDDEFILDVHEVDGHDIDSVKEDESKDMFHDSRLTGFRVQGSGFRVQGSGYRV